MVKPGALLLLLAVAASQVDLSLAQTDTSTCSVNFYGRLTNWVQVLSNADSSFSVCFLETDTEPPTECLFFSYGGSATFTSVSVVTAATSTGSVVLTNLPSLTTSSTCYLSITMQDSDGTNYEINVYEFSSQVALQVDREFLPDNSIIQAMLGDEVMYLWEFTTQPTGNIYRDISACRHNGVPVFFSSDRLFEDTCEIASCDAAVSLSVDSTCTGYEVCQGSNICIVPTVVCTVTGSTVIDFNNRTHTITDRCRYDLVGTSEGNDYLAVIFRERRLKDVPFVDQLKLYVESSSKYVTLKQGGIVEVEGEILTLSDTLQTFHGAELSKDDSGVTAKIPSTGMTVKFDGNTVHVSGLVEPLMYLCGDPADASVTTTLPDEKSSLSDSDCDTPQTDAPDTTIDTVAVNDACAVMEQAPFTACNDLIDPEPFKEACLNTMTVYPDVDGLFCQFYEAYAVSCSLRTGINLGDWKSATNCDVVLQHACRDQFCSSHEFCGEMLGHTRCLCRALYADTYRSAGTLGDPILCVENTATLNLAACLLWEDGVDPLSLHLNDPTCTGDLDDETHMITFNFGSSTCATEIVMMENNDVVFQNTIMTSNTASDITRDDFVEIDFSCYYVQPDSRTVSFLIADGSVTLQVDSDEWTYTLMMTAHSDPGRYHLIEPGSLVYLNQRIWLELTAEGLDDRVAVVIDSCWATTQQSGSGVPRHDLITDGCPSPNDPTVITEVNGLGHSVYFSVYMFEFFDDDPEVYLHCQVELCPMDPGCAPDCSGPVRRKRRSSSSEFANGTQTLITMTWRK